MIDLNIINIFYYDIKVVSHLREMLFNFKISIQLSIKFQKFTNCLVLERIMYERDETLSLCVFFGPLVESEPANKG